MTYLERLVLKLLVQIWMSIRQAPGVAHYEEDDILQREAEEALSVTYD